MKNYEIRQLVENYYDIQKIRVETFNRLVCWVKENKDKLKEKLSQLSFETQRNNASHFMSETQSENASHKVLETHSGNALKLLEEAEKQKGVKGMKKYSEFVKKFVLSHTKHETQLGNASQEKNETHPKVASQYVRETHMKSANLFSEIENLIWFHNKLYETEKELQKRLDFWSKGHRLRKEFLNHVKGIGGVFASGIIAWLCDPMLKAEKVSSIWKYCGLYPHSERRRGKKLPYNLRLKTFLWKVGQSFIKYKCFGRKLYEQFKEETKQKHPDWTKLHIHNYTRRKVVKIFLACLWAKWRKMNNLTTTKPYSIEVLGHSTLVTPENWEEKEAKDWGDEK